MNIKSMWKSRSGIMDALLKRKSGQIGFCIFVVLFAAYTIYGYAGWAQQSHTRALEREFGAAADRLLNSPPGVERAEVFVQTLKKIDPGLAPAEVKAALHDYIAAFERSLEAAKSGKDTAPYDSAVAETRQRLLSCVKKYD